MPAAPGLGAARLATAERLGEPADLVVPPDPLPAGGLALLVRPTRRALVLGSGQDAAAADLRACAAADVTVVRRRSGGGAVVVGPADQVWLDVFIPVGHPRFDPDVSRSAWWLGDLWASALHDAGIAGAAVHRGPLVAGPFGRAACFAGLGPGEVTVAGRKLVGISQRRDRRGAWLFTMASCRPPGAAPSLVDLLHLDPGPRAQLAGALTTTTADLAAPADRVEAALLARLAG